MNRWNRKFQALEEWKLRALDRAKAKGLIPKFVPIKKSMVTVSSSFSYGCPAKPKEDLNGKPFDGPSNFQRKLEKKGFVELGHGCFSTVMAKKDSDKVIKITRKPDGWIDYCHWAAKEGFAGKFAPRVYSYKRFNNKAPFEVSVVERMDKTFWDVEYKEDIYVVRDLARLVKHGNQKASSILEEMAPGFPRFIKGLGEKFDKSLDMHDGNIMLRKDGSICYTDPVSVYDYVPSFTRLKSKDFTQ